MKTIGIIGGMSWESTAVYYQHLNRIAKERLGGLHSAQLLLWSFDFAEIEEYQAAGDWDSATESMVQAAQRLELGGAECIVIATNTMHLMARNVQSAVQIPLIHIADATAVAIKKARSEAPLLLGTRFTMEKDFYKGHLQENHDISARIPNDEDRETVHRVIYEELCKGQIRDESREAYLDIVSRNQAEGADGVIFGCTEVGLLIADDDLSVPAFDTARLHAEAAMDFALA